MALRDLQTSSSTYSSSRRDVNLRIDHLAGSGRGRRSPVTWVAVSLMGLGSHDCSARSQIPVPLVAFGSLVLSICLLGGRGERRKSQPLLSAWSPPTPALAEHPFCWAVEAAKLGPVHSLQRADGGCLGYLLGTRKNLSPLAKPSHKVTTSYGIWAHPTISKFLIIPSWTGPQTFPSH